MKKICIFDTATGSSNIGDQIIMESFEEEMNDILKQGFCLRVPTHHPICHFYQDIKRNPMIRYLRDCDWKFIGGTNILLKNMMLPLTQWNINLWNSSGYRQVITVGCGLNPNSNKINWYTKRLYKKIFSKEYIHSVRDENTEKFMKQLGLQVINTGCPTLWSITPELCKKIPTDQSDSVIFTLTDYLKDPVKDQQLINILNNHYQKIYFFPQGIEDEEYLHTFTNLDKIEILSPNLKSFEEKLLEGNCDYVGTRLHAGIYAIKHQVRSIIIIIDNRARDMSKNHHFNCIERNHLENLDKMIQSNLETKIQINKKNIEIFKSQFME